MSLKHYNKEAEDQKENATELIAKNCASKNRQQKEVTSCQQKVTHHAKT